MTPRRKSVSVPQASKAARHHRHVRSPRRQQQEMMAWAWSFSRPPSLTMPRRQRQLVMYRSPSPNLGCLGHHLRRQVTSLAWQLGRVQCIALCARLSRPHPSYPLHAVAMCSLYANQLACSLPCHYGRWSARPPATFTVGVSLRPASRPTMLATLQLTPLPPISAGPRTF